MNIRLAFVGAMLIGGLWLNAPASAHEPAKPAPIEAAPAVTTTKSMPVFVQNVAPDAVEAVKAVDAFSTAIKAARLEQAAQLLDAKVLILESGSSERSRDEYMQEHAIADAAFMQTAQQQLRYRQARRLGDIAWVGTESLLQTTRDGQPLLLLSTETMVLQHTDAGWKIVHIHWSSRPAPKPKPTA